MLILLHSSPRDRISLSLRLTTQVASTVIEVTLYTKVLYTKRKPPLVMPLR